MDESLPAPTLAAAPGLSAGADPATPPVRVLAFGALVTGISACVVVALTTGGVVATAAWAAAGSAAVTALIEGVLELAASGRGRMARFVDEKLEGWWETWGGGFYGMMAGLTWTWLEAVEIAGLVRGGAPSGWREMLHFEALLELWIELMVGSIENLVAAGIWFVTAMDVLGDAWLPVLGAAFVAHAAALQLVKDDDLARVDRAEAERSTFELGS